MAPSLVLHREWKGSMKRSKFSEEQIAYPLRQVEGGTPVPDVCRQMGVNEVTVHVWKKKHCASRRERVASSAIARGGRRAPIDAAGRRIKHPCGCASVSSRTRARGLAVSRQEV